MKQCLVLSLNFHCKKNDGAVHMIQKFWQKTRLLWFARLLTPLIWLPVTSGCSCLKVGYFSNRPRTNENLMRALNTTLLKCCLPSTVAINRREKNSCMCMKVQGCLMQARFIEIHQVFAKKKSNTFLTDLVVFK